MSSRESPSSAIATFDELRQKLVDEQKRRPPEIQEIPEFGWVAYTINPTNIPLDYVDLGEYANRLRQLFNLSVDTSKVPRLLQQQDSGLDVLLGFLRSEKSELPFHNGILHFSNPERTTPIVAVEIGTEVTSAAVVGSTSEAAWVAQKAVEELWNLAGAARKWSDLIDANSFVGFRTTTRIDLGVNLIDLFSDRFQMFITTETKSRGSLGTLMGRHPLFESIRSSEQGSILTATQIHGVRMRISLFNEITGVFEDCDVQLDVGNRSEMGRGVLRVTTELDSANHTQFISRLRDAILPV